MILIFQGFQTPIFFHVFVFSFFSHIRNHPTNFINYCNLLRHYFLTILTKILIFSTLISFCLNYYFFYSDSFLAISYLEIHHCFSLKIKKIHLTIANFMIFYLHCLLLFLIYFFFTISFTFQIFFSSFSIIFLISFVIFFLFSSFFVLHCFTFIS